MGRPTGKRKQFSQEQEFIQPNIRPAVVKKAPPLKAQTANQQKYMNACRSSTLTFATGPAGTGKTYIAAAIAAEALENGTIEKIIITRPCVEAGEKLGALPGELDEKFDPYFQPFREALNERLGKGKVDYLIKAEKIIAKPLAFMRGSTFKDAYVILDEAQNTSPVQMKMFLTRIGENCKVIVNGDAAQKDIPGMSGIVEAVTRLSHIPSVQHIHFEVDDIVRSGLVREIVQAYNAPLHDFAAVDLF